MWSVRWTTTSGDASARSRNAGLADSRLQPSCARRRRARTRTAGSSGRGRLRRVGPSGYTRTGPHRITRGRRGVILQRSCASKDADSTRSGSGPPSSAAAAGTWTSKSWPQSPISATRTARRRRSVPATWSRRLRTCSSKSRSGSSSVTGDRRVLEVPTTHSIGMLARGLLGPFRRPIVHAYFHDTDLLDHGRAAALRVGLSFLGLKRTVTDLDELQRGLRPEKTMSFANSRA